VDQTNDGVGPTLDVAFGNSSQQFRCPLCFDGLPKDPTALAYCQGCGTGYHSECTSLARGRCPILGCVGLLGALETAPRFALVLDPGEGDLDDGAAEALAEFLEVDAYDARLKCQLPIPSVLRWCSAEELEIHQRDLAALGVRTFAARAEELTEALYQVQTVSLKGTTVEAWDGDGSGKGVQVDCESAGFVVLGRYEDQRASTRNQGGAAGMSNPGADITRRQSNTRFVHVYPDAGSQPLEFSYERIKDHRYLGDSMEPSGVANFARLATLLSEKARVNDTLLRLSGRFVTVSSDSTQRTSTNRPWALAASRLLWLADQQRRFSSGKEASE
jgi:hypothetical protein